MKAVLCQAYGSLDALAVHTVTPPRPAADEVIVAVRAAGVNFRDLLSVQNKYQRTPTPPFCPGCEAVGIVKEVGSAVRAVRAGDDVIAFTAWGAFAEEAKAEAAALLPRPAGMSDSVAAAFLLSYGTADHALRDRARLQPGESLAVLGAAGAAGLAAIEVGKALGAHVIACASTDDRLAVCRAHGADDTVNYSDGDLREALRRLAGARGVDVVYDPIGGRYTEPALRSLAWRGRLLVIGFAAGDIPKIPLNLALLKGCSIVGVWWGDFVRKESAAFLDSGRRLTDWYGSGRLMPHVSATMPLDRAGDALKLIADRQSVGKVVLSVQDGAV
jgi:NADPH2:quinone reductase